jgi:hypothetical protein
MGFEPMITAYQAVAFTELGYAPSCRFFGIPPGLRLSLRTVVSPYRCSPPRIRTWTFEFRARRDCQLPHSGERRVMTLGVSAPTLHEASPCVARECYDTTPCLAWSRV